MFAGAKNGRGKKKSPKKTTSKLTRKIFPSPSFLLLLNSTNRTAWTIDAEAKALRHVSASTAALIYSSEPLWGAAFAAAFLGERFEGAKGWIGASLVVGASLVAQVGGAAGKKGVAEEKSE